MAQFVDLVKTMSMLKHRSLSDMNIVGKFGGIVTEPIDDLPIPESTAFIEFELLCGAFNREIMESCALSEAHKYLIRNMKPVHFLLGTIYVLADTKYVNRGIYSINGRLSMVKGTKCSYYMSKWGRDDNNVYSRIPVAVFEPNESVYTAEYMDWIKRSKELGTIVTSTVPVGVQITGKEVRKPIFISKNLTIEDIKNGLQYCDGNTEERLQTAKKVVTVENPFNNIGISKIKEEPFIKSNSDDTYRFTEHLSSYKSNDDTDIMRDKISMKSNNYPILESAVDNARRKIDETLKSFTENKSDIEEICIRMFAGSLSKFWKRKPVSGEGSTGSSIFKQSVLDVAKFMYAKDDDDEKGDSIKEIEATLDMYMDSPKLAIDWGMCNTEVRSLRKFLIDWRADLMYAVFQNVADLKCDMLKLNTFCKKLDYTLLDIINENPYKLCLIDSSVSLSDMDKIAMGIGLFRQSDKVELQRNIAVMHQYMTDVNNAVVNGSTVLTKRTLLKNFKSGYSLSKYEYNNLMQFTVGEGLGVFLKKDTYINIMNYFTNMEDKFVSIPCTGWLSDGNRYILPSKFNNEEIYNGYVESGLGVKYVIGGIEYISDYQIVSKEDYIYNRVYRLSGSGKPCKDIDKLITEFEKLKSKELGIENFRLEDRQREAVKMVEKSSVFAIIGGAGCGKTTTAEAVVYALQRVYEFSDDEIRFVAPTGKAANRLKESVKRDTCTIHSLCRIGGTSNFISSDSIMGDKDKEDNTKAIIIDESSMINLDVMYSFMKWVKNGTKLIFLGDTGQLPAIGFGKIFADLLKYIPCVTLNVSKRAAAGSLITRNAGRIIKESDGDNIEDLETGDDFKCIDMEQEMIPVAISELVKYHLGYSDRCSIAHIDTSKMGELTADDIQVVTPVKTKRYKWGSEHLNPIIQDIINPATSRKRSVTLYLTQNDTREFRVGDRVIHTVNITDMTRYQKHKGKYIPIASTGIMNGDVGKIKSIYLPDEIKSITEYDDLLKLCSYNSIFIEVEYEDVEIINEDGSSKFSIFYIANTSKDLFGRPTQINGSYTVTGGTLKLIDLAYALTVHKMQGSQAKLIVIPYFNIPRYGFLSRNMLYTAVTRASKGCYLLGDVTGNNSAVSRSRRLEVVSKRHSVVESIV